MKKFFLLLIAISSIGAGATTAKPNKDLMKANYLYRQLAFYEAIPFYEKVADSSNDPELLAQLADCYKLTGNISQAAAWYAKAVAIKDCPAIVKLHYGQSLMTLGKYDEAINWLKQYRATVPDEKRVANLIRSCEEAPAALKEMPDGYVSFLNFNTDGSDFGPALNNGELVFTSDTFINKPNGAKTDEWSGHSFYNLYSVTCDQNGNCSNQIKKVAADINTKYHDGPATFADNGNTMYFTRTSFTEKFLSRGPLPDLNGTVHLQIMVASGYNVTGKFEKITPFQYNSKQYSTAQPTVSPDGNMLVFVSDMPEGKGGNDLYFCRKDTTTGRWSEPHNISVLNTEGDEMFPVFLDNENLGFSSNGLVGFGGLDIYKTKWDENAQRFTQPVHFNVPVNSSYDDMSLSLANGGTSGYFASNRPAPKKGDNIYFVNLQNIYLSVRVLDEVTGAPVKAASVSLKGVKQDSKEMISGTGGSIFTSLLPQTSYEIAVNKAGYKTHVMNISTFDVLQNDTLTYEVRLAPEFNIHYQAVVLDEVSRQPLNDVSLVVSKLGGAVADTALLEPGEVFKTALDPDAEYSIYALKDNYFSNEKFISTKGISHTVGGVTLKDTIYMKELKVGEVYKIENIYYDFDKANIREDAKKSLNSLINLLNQYPEMTIQINSYTDCRGSDRYNLNLSNARAHSVINYLQERGISRSRLHYKGFGESHPAVDCNCPDCTEEQYQQNRRTEFQIISM